MFFGPNLVSQLRVLPRLVNITSVRYAGHNKWSNIRHTKTAKDAAKAQVIMRQILLIRHAITSGGGVDPKINDKLADALSEAKKNEVPAATIERALKRASEKKMKPFLLELVGPGNVFILVEGESDNVGSTRTSVKKQMAAFKGSYNWGREGAIKGLFIQRGMVSIDRKDKDGNPIDFDKAEEVGIEAGAEEVVQPEPEDSESKSLRRSDEEETWDLVVSKDELFSVKGYIEKNRPDIVIKDFGIGYYPRTYIEVSDQDLQKLSDIVDALHEVAEVTKIYVNIK